MFIVDRMTPMKSSWGQTAEVAALSSLRELFSRTLLSYSAEAELICLPDLARVSLRAHLIWLLHGEEKLQYWIIHCPPPLVLVWSQRFATNVKRIKSNRDISPNKSIKGQHFLDLR